MSIWKGNYSLRADNVERLQDKKVEFELHLEIADGSFKGKMLDSAYAELSEEIVAVSGFFDDNFISFIVTYPVRAIPNSAGLFALDTNIPNNEVTFYGEFEDNSKKIIGYWEIVENTEIGVFGVNVLYSNGAFEMEEQ